MSERMHLKTFKSRHADGAPEGGMRTPAHADPDDLPFPKYSPRHTDDPAQLTCAIEQYRACCDNIRSGDDVSLKLLASVPVLAGVAIALLLPNKGDGIAATNPLVSVALGIFGLLATLAIYLWERRNIQMCRWFRGCAKALEEGPLRLQEDASMPNGDLQSSPHIELAPPTFLKLEFGKKRAEHLLYSTVLCAWAGLVLYGVVRSIIDR